MKKGMTIEDLARMIQNNVAMKDDLKALATKEDLKSVEKRLTERMDKGFEELSTRLDDTDIDIASHNERITKLERKSRHL